MHFANRPETIGGIPRQNLPIHAGRGGELCQFQGVSEAQHLDAVTQHGERALGVPHLAQVRSAELR